MKQYNVRYQLKSDTETNWNKAGPKEGSAGFIPLNGELIIYQADSNHSFSRIKIGDGVTNVVALPFIDAGTLNGTDIEVVKLATRSAFPATGSVHKLYIDLSTGQLWHYTKDSGYLLLSDFNFETTTVSNIVGWDAGLATSATITNHKFFVSNGTSPYLNYEPRLAITSITRGEE